MTLGKALRRIRLERGLRQSDVAGLVGVHLETYSRWEAGKFQPKARQLVDLATVLQVKEEELLHPERMEE